MVTARIEAADGYELEEPSSATVTVTDDDAAPAITGFALIDAADGPPDEVVAVLGAGAVVDLTDVASDEFTIRADVVSAGSVGSVVLQLSGAKEATRTEGGLPYSLYGDRGGNDYAGEGLPSGAYRIEATPYAGTGGNGAPLDSFAREFTVVREPRPQVAIRADLDAAPEGGTLDFTLTRTAAATELTVSVSVSETGDTLWDEVPSTVRFPADATTASLAVATVDDAEQEPDSVVTVRVEPGEGYGLGEASSATATVTDDDSAAPAVSPLALTVTPRAVHEAAPPTAVTVTVAMDGILDEATPVSLSVVAGTAVPGADFAAVPDFDVTVAAGDDTAEAQFELVPLADDEAEWSETLIVRGSAPDLPLADATLLVTDSAAQHHADADIDTLDAAGNQSPIALWSDGETLWVADNDPADSRIYAYRLADGERLAALDIDSGAEDIRPQGLAFDGEVLWVLGDAMVHAYDLDTRQRIPARDFGVTPGYGLWSNGRTLWVTDDAARRLAAEDFDVDDAQWPMGVWSDGALLCVADYRGSKVYAYDTGTRARAAYADVDALAAAGNRLPSGLWSDGITLWVADLARNKLYAYRPPGAAVALAAAEAAPTASPRSASPGPRRTATSPATASRRLQRAVRTGANCSPTAARWPRPTGTTGWRRGRRATTGCPRSARPAPARRRTRPARRRRCRNSRSPRKPRQWSRARRRGSRSHARPTPRRGLCRQPPLSSSARRRPAPKTSGP